MRLTHCMVIGSLLAGLTMATPLPAQAMATKGKPAPAFALTSVTGPKLDLATLRGKVVLVDFFATWCGPCKDTIPHLVDLQRRLGNKGLQVVGLSADDDDDQLAVREFVTTYRINYPVALAPESVRDDYGLRAVPVLFIIDKKGAVVDIYRGLGGDMKKRLEELLQKLLAS